MKILIRLFCKVISTEKDLMSKFKPVSGLQHYTMDLEKLRLLIPTHLGPAKLENFR